MSGSSRRAPAFLPAFCALMFFVGFEMGGFQFALRGISAEFSIDSIGSGLLVSRLRTGMQTGFLWRCRN